jgi:Pectate lyase superfamily protein
MTLKDNISQRRALLASFASGAVIAASIAPSSAVVTYSNKANSPNTFTKFSDRPRNLTAADAGLSFLFTQTGNFHLWTGSGWKVLNESVINVKDYGAVGDSIVDDTNAIRLAVDRASDFYRQLDGYYPLSYGAYDSSTVLFPHGNYRITDTIAISNGLTITGISDQAFTVGTTRVIMDTRGDESKTGRGGQRNLDKHIFRFELAILDTDNVARVRNERLNVTICDLEFWIMNPNSLITQRTGEGWPTNPGNDDLGMYSACCIYINIPCVDTRIKRCNFYSTPNAAIYFDHQDGTKIISNCFIDGCEFDTPITALRARNADLAITMSDCEFWNSSYSAYLENCVGSIQFIGNQFVQSPRINVKESCRLSVFAFSGNKVDLSGGPAVLTLNSCDTINVSANTFFGNYGGAILANDCNGGVITSNSISSSGLGFTGGAPGSELSTPAAIKLTGCSGIVVSANSITTPIEGQYNGFGILTLDSGRNPSRCLVSNNVVSSRYNAFGEAATLYRNQNRWVNLSRTDQAFGGNLIV